MKELVTTMSFQWLQMRISEENDRRKREGAIMERLPRALEETHQAIALCVANYQAAFGADAAEILLQADKIRITVRTEKDGRRPQNTNVEIVIAPSIPGFQVDRGVGGEPLIIEVGVLPGDKLFYRDRAKDQYVNMEELTRRILDRAFFPGLDE
jgi:hypothetical protein